LSLTCRAAVFAGQSGQFEFRDFAIPQPTGDEIVVRVLGCTLCASDLHSCFGRRHTPTPSILGHEIVGEITAFGESAPRLDLRGRALAIGDRVVWTLVASCGDCAFCHNGLPQKCLRAVKYGHHVLETGRELLGGLAEYCLLLPGTGVVRLPDALTLAEACPAGCATATIAAAIDAAGALRDRTVLIVGAGMLGLTACAMARSHGAAEVLCVDPQPERRSQGLACGATQVFSPDEIGPAIHAATDGLCVDVALEISGANAGFETCWNGARVGGRIILLGAVFPSPAIPVTIEQIVRRNLTIHGVHNYAPRHLVQAVEFLENERQNYPLGNLVAEWFPLAQVEDAFRRASLPSSVRVGVVP
jgi:putative phosphonate catabolism associated alcohol dehydrogenase